MLALVRVIHIFYDCLEMHKDIALPVDNFQFSPYMSAL